MLWLAHESAPKNVTAVDVTDPRKPTVIVQTALPHERMRSNSLDLVGDMLVVAYQTQMPGLTPAGFEIFDVADPAKPRSIAFFDASGPASRGVHHLWFVDGEYVHMAAGAADFTPRNPQGRPVLPHRGRAPAQPPDARSAAGGCRARGTATPSRRRRAIPPSTPVTAPTTPTSTPSAPTARGSAISTAAPSSSTSPTWRTPASSRRWDYHPPFPGFCHTLLPLLDRGLLVVSDESVGRRGQGLAQARVDPGHPRRDEAGADQHLSAAPGEDLRPARRTLRRPQPAREPPGAGHVDLGDVIVGTFFNGGVRAFDVSDPFRPTEVAWAVPPAPRKSRAKAIQLNDVFVDERQIVYTVDRLIGGLYIYEMRL